MHALCLQKNPKTVEQSSYEQNPLTKTLQDLRTRTSQRISQDHFARTSSEHPTRALIQAPLMQGIFKNCIQGPLTGFHLSTRSFRKGLYKILGKKLAWAPRNESDPARTKWWEGCTIWGWARRRNQSHPTRTKRRECSTSDTDISTAPRERSHIC